MEIRRLWLVPLLMGSVAADAAAQVAVQSANTPTTSIVHARNWEFEVHAGASIGANPTGGSGALPSIVSMGFKASATSFYFGDGAQVFNQNVVTLPGTATIIPLDPLLLGSAVTQSHAVVLGLRVSRALTRWVTAEGSVDSGPGAFEFTSGALAGLEATRASYIPALQHVLAGTAPTVTSVTAITDHQAPSQVVLAGTLLVNLVNDHRAVPYVVAGAGTLWSSGSMPSATLTGQFTYGTVGQITSIDSVALSYGLTSFRPVGVVGAGVKYRVRETWGIRVDARANVYRSPVTNLLNANPTTTLSAGVGPYPLINVGQLQFSTTGSLSGISVAAVPGTKLTTGALPPGAPTWSGALDAHVGITLGVFWRF